MNKKPSESEFAVSSDLLRQKLLRRMMTIVIGSCLIFFPFVPLRALAIGFKPIQIVQSLFFCAVLGIFLARRRLGLRVSAAGMLLTLLAWFLASIGSYGILAPALLVAPFFTIFSSILLGRRVALWFFWTSTLGLALIAALFLSGANYYRFDVHSWIDSSVSWAALIVLQAMLALWYLFLVAPLNEAERHLSERLDAVLQGINDALFIHDKNTGAILQVNQKMCTMYGYSQEEALCLRVEDLSAGVPPYTQKEADAWIALTLKDGPQLFEWQAKERTGRLFWVEVSMRLANLDGTERLLLVVRDISERKRIEAALKAKEEQYRSIVENAPMGIFRRELEGTYLYFNDTLTRHFECMKREEFLSRYGLIRQRWAHPEQHEVFKALLLKNGNVLGFEMESRLVTGKTKWFSLYAYLEPSRTTFNGFSLDVTERKLAEVALRDSEKKFASAFQIVPHPLSITRVRDGAIIEVNDAFVTLTGYPRQELLGHNAFELGLWNDPQDRSQVVAELIAGQVVQGREFQFRRRDGGILTCLFSGQVFQLGAEQCILACNVDISERKRADAERQLLQAQLYQAQKLESIGRLAGGVAHDFNNQLGVILAEAELALVDMNEKAPHRKALEQIVSAVERSSALTRQLLAFARQQPIAPRVLDLNKTVETSLRMLKRLMGENIVLDFKPGRELRPVKLDPSQTDQLLANLCVNARDAIAGVGKITIETLNAVFDDAYCAEHQDCAPGDYVMLAVSDDGCGMTREVRERIFEPFFTTKELGKGTGIGLATVHGIVKQNEGSISVHSERGQGTTFRIYLRQYQGQTATVESPDEATLPLGNGETVLLVEDDPSLLTVTQTMLERLGFKVLPAATPIRALADATIYSGEIPLLVTDLIMPDMNGRELYNRMAARRPGLRCLYVSGYTADVIAQHGVLEPGVNFLSKPISMQSLSVKLREVLADRVRAES